MIPGTGRRLMRQPWRYPRKQRKGRKETDPFTNPFPITGQVEKVPGESNKTDPRKPTGVESSRGRRGKRHAEFIRGSGKCGYKRRKARGEGKRKENAVAGPAQSGPSQ